MLKVHLQYPWKFPDSSYYKSMITYPPKNINYVNVKKDDFEGIISSDKIMNILLVKKVIRSVMDLIKRPNLIKSKKGEYDLIHCAHCLSLNKTPWVVDSESYWNLSATSDIAFSEKGKNQIRNILKSKYCKKIMPWTNFAKNRLITAMNDKEIEDKIEVIPYALPLPKIKKIPHNHITFLFIGRYFYQKGGLTAIKVFDYLIREYNSVNVIIVSEIPDKIKEEYKDLLNNPRVRVYPLMKQEQLMNEIYPKADVFFYPGYTDSFGFMMVEAMSYGIPTITADGYARRDVVTDNKTGLIVPRDLNIKGFPKEAEEKELLKGFLNKANQLIINPQDIKRLGRNALEEVRTGKYCLEKRNRKLKRIYEEALK